MHNRKRSTITPEMQSKMDRKAEMISDLMSVVLKDSRSKKDISPELLERTSKLLMMKCQMNKSIKCSKLLEVSMLQVVSMHIMENKNNYSEYECGVTNMKNNDIVLGLRKKTQTSQNRLL